MTISSFCRDLLLARGPLPLETLAERAAAAGATTARDPAAAVRSALAYREVQLSDRRWATPLWLLEGRILTARRLPIARDWAWDAVEDDEALLDPEALLDDPDLHDLDLHHGIHGTAHDLALLDLAAHSRPLPLAAGGLLHSDRYRSAWRVPKGWPGLRAGRDQLLGLRVREGQLHVELVPVTEELHRAGADLGRELGPLDAPGRYWSPEPSLVADNLAAALWNRMADDPAFLTSPVPPFSECVPPLADALRRERDRRAAEARHWRPQLDLPAALQDVAVDGARRSGQLLPEWLNAFATWALRDLDDSQSGTFDDETATVLPLRGRRRRGSA